MNGSGLDLMIFDIVIRDVFCFFLEGHYIPRLSLLYLAGALALSRMAE